MSLVIKDIRQKIWKAAKAKVEIIDQAKDNIDFADDWQALLKEVRKLVKKPVAVPDKSWRPRYRNAHVEYQKKETPAIINDQIRMMNGKPGWSDDMAYLPTNYPDINTSNGLTRFVISFLMWEGHRATRVNVQGRLIEGQEKQESGVTLSKKKFIKSTTRTGSADISSTISGASVMWEIKAGKDKPSTAQLKEQAREIKAGGKYFFIHSPAEFFSIYDSLFK